MKFACVAVALIQACAGTKVASELQSVNLDLPKVPKVSNPGPDGLPELPELSALIGEFSQGRKEVNTDASTFAKHVAEMEKTSQSNLVTLRASYNDKLKKQEIANQAVVTEVSQLAKSIIARKKANAKARSDVAQTEQLIKSRREQFRQLQEELAKEQQAFKDILDSSDTSKEVALLSHGADLIHNSTSKRRAISLIQQPREETAVPAPGESTLQQGDLAEIDRLLPLSFLEMTEAEESVVEDPLGQALDAQSNLENVKLETATPSVALAKHDEEESAEEAKEAAEDAKAVDLLLEDLKKMRVGAKHSEAKLKEIYDQSLEVGKQRAAGLQREKEILQAALDKEEEYSAELAKSSKHLTAVLTALTDRLKKGGEFLRTLGRGASAAPVQAFSNTDGSDTTASTVALVATKADIVGSMDSFDAAAADAES
eukprot:TRINITY_DN5626_c1_g1_i5.p1 TRINITY_DN5626_c1_g1~~TRINITY_DN5626_c1_g1_i5.p1  ORF type:complete len:429 (+),score=135.59 TRINITY_DN5626_c1_g1_i5:51-1337(+)